MNEKTLRIFVTNLLDGIKAMHNTGICHRDLNPSNILCSDNGYKVKIIDLGAHGLFGKGESNHMTTIHGTMSY